MENPEVDPQFQTRERPEALDADRLLNELAAARKRIDELARAYQDGERDREAFKLRVQRERERMLDVERGQIALTLIEAVDELDLCLRVPDGSRLFDGVQLIRAKLLKKLEASQIERVELVGLTFDPELAEAVDMDVTPNPDEDGQITDVVVAAYRSKGRVIRPGRVKVARYLKPAEA